MAKLSKASEEMVDLFDTIRSKTSIPNWVEFGVLSNDKQKKVYMIQKASEVVQTLVENINFVVIFNELIFDQLTDDQQEMAIIECLAGVCVNGNDAVSLEKPNFSTYRGVLEKYGHDPIVVLHESIKSLYDAEKQKEDEAKALTKGKRGRNKS